MARPLSEEARRKALLAGQELVAELGIEGFTVDAVARRSGVAKTTIYRHWESGNALLIDAIDSMVVPFSAPDTGSFRTDLIAFLEVLMPAIEEPGMARTMLGVMAAAASDPELHRIHQELMTERKAPLREIVAKAKARGEIPHHLDDDVVLDLIEGPFLARKVFRRTMGDTDEMTQLIDLIVAALTAA